ncbi:MAG: hypothetical protein GXY71_09290 [Treponema sp.]|nr:hypothetical protein [Treponema sp.]
MAIEYRFSARLSRRPGETSTFAEERPGNAAVKICPETKNGLSKIRSDENTDALARHDPFLIFSARSDFGIFHAGPRVAAKKT